MKTFDEMVKWIKDNVPKDKLEGHKSVREAAKWFLAYHEALNIRESASIKDMAHLVLEGLRPLNPVQHMKQLAEVAEDAKGNPVDPFDEDELREFFGLPKKEQP